MLASAGLESLFPWDSSPEFFWMFDPGPLAGGCFGLCALPTLFARTLADD